MVFSFIAPDGWKNVNERPNYISVLDLAEKIKRREDIQLIDLRSPQEYDEFHLPTARNLSEKDLVQYKMPESNTVVFYSSDDKQTSHLWSILDDQRKKQSYILYGGVHDWYSRLLYPKVPLNITPKDSLLTKKIISLSKFYGGRIEVSEQHHLLDYYRLDLESARSNAKSHHGSLRRKGC